MKNLKDSILEKLRIDDITFDEFHIDGTIDEMVKFLKEKGFQYNDGSKIKKAFNAAKSKSFMSDPTTIWFADTSKGETSKDNPIFYINFYGGDFDYRVYYIDNSDYTQYIVYGDKKMFLKKLNKRFGW